jgi:hypothetical protein
VNDSKKAGSSITFPAFFFSFFLTHFLGTESSTMLFIFYLDFNVKFFIFFLLDSFNLKMENKNLLDIDQKRKDPVKEESSLEEKIKNFFNKFAFLELSDDEKKEVALKITKDANFDILYWWEIFLSASIATL